MKAAYSYRRWSTKGQGDESRNSRKRQTDSADKWIAEHGNGEYYLSKEVFEDAGKSGYKGKHLETDAYGKAKGELMRFIQMVEAGKIKHGSILLIDEYSRFSRLPATKSLALFSQVISSGIGIVFTGSHEKRVINESLLTKEPHILYFIIGEMIRSYTESAERSRKIIAAKQSKKAMMQAGAIVAHNNIPKYFTFNCDKKVYEHNDKTPIVIELVNGILAGKSLYEMTVDLNKREIGTFRYGAKWHPCSVRQILRNPVLKGEYLGNKDYVPEIIDADTFARIQNILKGNSSNRGKKSELVNIFRGIAFCGHCGHHMTVTGGIKKGIPYRYLRCTNYYVNNKNCNTNFIRLKPMEEDFFGKFLAKNPHNLVNGEDKAELEALQKEITIKTSRLNSVSSNIEKLFEMMDGMDVSEGKAKLSKLNSERDDLKTQLDDLNLKINSIQDTPEIKLPDEVLVEIEDVPMTLDNSIKGPVYTTEDEAHWFRIYAALANNEWREKVRVVLPALIGKVVIKDHKFFVYNRMGRLVSESSTYPSLRNNTDQWKASLKTWTTRKRNGNIEKVARKVKSN